MSLPRWLPIVIGALVIVFGMYRIRLFLRTDTEEEAARKRGGMYGFPRRTHLLFGIAYILMGVFLLASSFGLKLPF